MTQRKCVSPAARIRGAESAQGFSVDRADITHVPIGKRAQPEMV